jgi:hypothetical protein
LVEETKYKSPAAPDPITGRGWSAEISGGAAPEKKSYSGLTSGSGQRTFINSNLNPIPQGEGNG